MLPNRVSYVELVELNVLDFDVILDMDWLNACFASIVCRIKVVKFNYRNEPIVEWKGEQAKWSLKVVCTILEYEIPPIKLVSVVIDFLEVFPNDFLGIPPKREIDFGIYLLLDTNPILIPPYRMAQDEMTELKAQHKDLLDKGFIT